MATKGRSEAIWATPLPWPGSAVRLAELRATSPAPGALALDQDLRDATDDRLGRAGRRGELDADLRQTGDLAALRADEVRVLGVQRVVGAAQLEAPHVVAEVDPAEQAGASEVDQVAVDRRRVVAVPDQRLDQLAVTERDLGRLQVLRAPPPEDPCCAARRRGSPREAARARRGLSSAACPAPGYHERP